MNIASLFVALSLFVTLGLGIAVFITNKTRRPNQAFLVPSSCMALWLLSNLYIMHTSTQKDAYLAIRLASAISTCIPSAFQILRLAIKYPKPPWSAILKRCRPQIILNILVVAVCFLPFFIRSISFSPFNGTFGLGKPNYGPPYILFIIYFLVSLVALALGLYKDRKVLVGAQRIESEFLVFACIASFIIGFCLEVILVPLTKTMLLVPIAHAISVLPLVTIAAYGISVHKILAVAVILRTITAYSLLSCYLTIVYLISWFCLSLASKELSIETTLPAHAIATLIVVFSMSAGRGRIQKVANKLVASQSMDVPRTMKDAGNIFQSVTTIHSLMEQFSALLKASLSTEHLIILTVKNETLHQAHPETNKVALENLPSSNSLQILVTKSREPVYREGLKRGRQTERTRMALHEFERFNMSISIGFFTQSNFRGLVLLGSRTGDRIYDKNEQDALQILCNQFAVALENAQLYTEMQDSKIRNEIMLAQLVSGVIMADPNRKITLINNEAERITGLKEEQALGQDIALLPPSISKALETTLATQLGAPNAPGVLFAAQAEKRVHVRMGSTYLMGHDDKPMGALLVFTDMTELKLLEEQIRRTNQLSSVGTLAAGMAHEIKNPLVTIKTFTQLLPDRHGDSEFREEFSSLVAHEVERIDGIVNQLLSFSKPSQPHLIPMKLHDTVEHTLKLIHEQLSQKHIELTHNFQAKQDLISGDADLLTQTLVNLNLNAIEAIGSEGTICVETSNCIYRFAHTETPGKSTKKSCICLQITDTGKGIPRDHLQKIFDPFFTSKSEGTGMGLAVSHGIIQEHQGVITVDSLPGKGTVFSIYIPLLKEDAAA